MANMNETIDYIIDMWPNWADDACQAAQVDKDAKVYRDVMRKKLQMVLAIMTKEIAMTPDRPSLAGQYLMKRNGSTSVVDVMKNRQNLVIAMPNTRMNLRVDRTLSTDLWSERLEIVEIPM